VIRGVLLAIGLVLAVMLLAFFQSSMPRYATLTGPVETTGRQADHVLSATFGVKVGKLILARTLVQKGFGRPGVRQTQGTWLIVSAELQARQETMGVRAAAIRGASGRIYRQTHRADGAAELLTTKDLQPGLPSSGIFVFELPEQETKDMTLILSRQLLPQLDSQISVRLDQNSIVKQEKVEIGGNAG